MYDKQEASSPYINGPLMSYYEGSRSRRQPQPIVSAEPPVEKNPGELGAGSSTVLGFSSVQFHSSSSNSPASRRLAVGAAEVRLELKVTRCARLPPSRRDSRRLRFIYCAARTNVSKRKITVGRRCTRACTTGNTRIIIS